MSDINKMDDYLHRLGKLVPPYIIALVVAIEPLLNIFTEIFLQVAVTILLILAALVLIYQVEIKNQELTRQDQVVAVAVSTVLYLVLFLVRAYVELGVELQAFSAFVVILYTIVVPQVIK
jgi:hypothetical protein